MKSTGGIRGKTKKIKNSALLDLFLNSFFVRDSVEFINRYKFAPQLKFLHPKQKIVTITLKTLEVIAT